MNGKGRGRCVWGGGVSLPFGKEGHEQNSARREGSLGASEGTELFLKVNTPSKEVPERPSGG